MTVEAHGAERDLQEWNVRGFERLRRRNPREPTSPLKRTDVGRDCTQQVTSPGLDQTIPRHARTAVMLAPKLLERPNMIPAGHGHGLR